MTYLRQFLPWLLMPLTVSLLLALAGLWRKRRGLIWMAVVLLWISSLPVVAGFLTRVAEGSSGRGLASDAPAADAIVVLSGDRIIAPGSAGVSEWRDANRFFGGLELFQAGRAPLLVFTAAAPHGPAGAPSHGETMTLYARAWGVPADRMAVTGPVRNTEDEAREAAALLRGRVAGRPRVLLVTSAYHMPRAQRLFERAGLTVLPFPVDFRRSADHPTAISDFFPKASALLDTHVILREFYGRAWYRVFGS